MTQPQNLDARVTALETRVTQMQTALSSIQAAQPGVTARITGMEQVLAAAEPRLLFLEEAARGFETRVKALEAVSHSPSNADASRLAAVEASLLAMQQEVARLGQVARPGRTVLRDKLSALESNVAEILSRLPPPAAG